MKTEDFDHLIEAIKKIKHNPTDYLSSTGVSRYFEHSINGYYIYFDYVICTNNDINWTYDIDNVSITYKDEELTDELNDRQTRALNDLLYLKIQIDDRLLEDDEDESLHAWNIGD